MTTNGVIVVVLLTWWTDSENYFNTDLMLETLWSHTADCMGIEPLGYLSVTDRASTQRRVLN